MERRNLMKIKIGNKYIGDNQPVFVVAEIGINHNGNLALAKKLIKKAKECGADAVKFQTYKTDLFINKKYAKSQYNLLKKYELSFEQFKKLKEFADKNDIIFFSSPFDFESAKFLIQLKVPAIKVASSELSNILFVKHLAKSKIPLIISTGMSTFSDIDNTYKKILPINRKIILLHCVSEYPLSHKDANLNVIPSLRNRYKTIVGFSDHSDHYVLDIIAVSLGAKVIEKHFTLKKTMKGPDHKLSLNPTEFRNMVTSIRVTEMSLGSNKKSLTSLEQKIKKYALKGIYASKDIKKGERISLNNIIFQRPLEDIPAQDGEKIIGKKVRRDISKGDSIKKEDI